MRRSQIGVFVHLVWATWDRLPLLVGSVEHEAYRAIGAKCRELGADIVALGGVEDHIHLLVRLPATLCIADLMKHVKGASGHLLAQKAAGNNEFFKWQGAYGAFSVSPRHLRQVSDYIAHQREHHTAGSLVKSWELAHEDDEE